MVAQDVLGITTARVGALLLDLILFLKAAIWISLSCSQ